MDTSRRTFLKKLGMAGGAALALPAFADRAFAEAVEHYAAYTPQQLVTDEDYWAIIAREYSCEGSIVNLNNGAVSPQPRVVQRAVEFNLQLFNQGPSWWMYNQELKGRPTVHRKLADLAGVKPEDVVINRNASEGLETIIFGMQLQKGDEVVLGRNDYGSMMNAYLQREKRDGIVLKYVEDPMPWTEETDIVGLYTKLITKKTKIVHITQVVHGTGQVVPADVIARLSAEAHKVGARVIVDGAHAFAQIDFKIPDLDCDYYATALHKWLCAPLGTGMLWVRPGMAADVYPMLATADPLSPDAKKFENLGTRHYPVEMAIAEAADFHASIGAARKEARLRYLAQYWAKPATQISGLKLNTSLNPRYSCALMVCSIEGVTGEELTKKLLDDHRIHVVGSKRQDFDGIRVTPHLYTKLSELDRLVEGLAAIAKAAKK